MATIKQTIKQNIENSLSRTSRGLIVRGVLAVAFGIAMVVWPGIGFGTLVLLVGAFAFVDGSISLGTAFTRAAEGQRGWLVFQGLAGVAVGVITLLYTDISALALLFVVGAWAIVLGITQLVIAFRVPMERSTRILVGLYGLLSIAFGVLMYVQPVGGAVALVALIAAFAIVTGSTLIAVGIEVRHDGESVLSDVFPTPVKSEAHAEAS
jgi:uncharacterized membrane protein HdeD (DUF308 family)